MADLPDISPDFSQPLPQVDPNSDLVPYRMSSTNPDQGEVVTTGYGPRARQPIQPPGGGGVGVPDMTGFLGEAMQHLPVDEALKATQAAAQYIAQRGYQRDIANGESAPKALLKWLPVMRNSTGLSEALQYQEAQKKAAQPTIRAVGGRLYRVPPIAGQAEAISPEPPPKVAPPKYFHNSSTGELLKVNPDGTSEVVREGITKPDETVTEEQKIPAVEAAEAQPASKGFLGFGAHPAIPAVAAAPERIIKTTRKLRADQPPVNFAPKETQAAPTPAPQAPPAPPKAQRRIGATYRTPKGLYTWTEGGWVKADDGK